MDDFQRGLIDSYEAVRRFALSLTRNATRADDLTQETMLKAITYRHTFQPGTNLTAWLFTILKSRFYSEHRHAKTVRAYADLKRLLASDRMEPDQETAMEHAEVLEEMARLPREQREAISMVGIEGQRYDEASVASGVPMGTIKSRTSRARETLQLELGSGRKPRGGRFVRRPKRATLTLYGERFLLAETFRLLQPDLRASQIRIFRRV